MSTISEEDRLGLDQENGARHYRAYVGPSKNYDLSSAIQFNLLTLAGLREHHYLLDIGCGSLRAGKLLIPYLLPERYCGVEPNEWLIKEGIDLELGSGIFEIKRPNVIYDLDFSFEKFGCMFDFIIAQSIFTHASPIQIERCFEQIQKVKNDDFVFFATFSEGKENYAGNDWVYPGCVFYKMDMFKELSESYNFHCERLNWPHPDDQTWIFVCDRYNEKKNQLYSHLSQIGKCIGNSEA